METLVTQFAWCRRNFISDQDCLSPESAFGHRVVLTFCSAKDKTSLTREGAVIAVRVLDFPATEQERPVPHPHISVVLTSSRLKGCLLRKPQHPAFC